MRLAPVRSRASVELDGQLIKARGYDEPLPMPPFMPWPQFLPWFINQWQAGQHVAIVAATQSGKTTLARQFLKARDFMAVMGTKKRDSALYRPLEQQGFHRTDNWDPYEWEQTKQRYVIFAPRREIPRDPTDKEIAQAVDKQSHLFRRALMEILDAGGWGVYYDEVVYLSEEMSLDRVMNLLWVEGASSDITIVAGTQRPRNVPRNMYAMATWFFVFGISDREDRKTASEFLGSLAPTVFVASSKLPEFEFICANPRKKLIVRSKVQL